jgi:tRNA-2-methylthio-N6-dimethylallyladenosine synthase
MSKTYYIETYGCQMNVADSELISGILDKEGYSESKDLEAANAIFVNTCAIRDHAEAKVHSRLGVFKKIKQERPDVLIGVLGCMAQNLKDDLLENKPYVDIILGPDSYRKLPNILADRTEDSKHIVDTKLSRYEVYDDLFPSRKEGINAWISIMRGCDKFCTFCIVPFTRGRERSRSIDSIVSEAQEAADQGYVEVTLLGQNVNSYNYEKHDFQYLLKQVAKIPGLKRIRYTSPHPQDISIDLLETMAAHENICNSIHLPLQAGSDRILKRMNRTYSREHFNKIADAIRSILPDAGISTDLIVGFPGETEDDFNETLEVMNHVKFESAFTFKYSPRPYTKAAQYSDQVPEDIKQERLERLIALQKQHTLDRNKAEIGNERLVLVEKDSRKSKNQWMGRTDSNKWVIFDKGTAGVKDLVKVKIQGARGVSLLGHLLDN